MNLVYDNKNVVGCLMYAATVNGVRITLSSVHCSFSFVRCITLLIFGNFNKVHCINLVTMVTLCHDFSNLFLLE